MGKFKRFEPIDRAAVSLMLLLSLAIGFLLVGGDRSLPKVRDFSWPNKQVGAIDTAFIITFSRPMDRASVEANLHVEQDYENLKFDLSPDGKAIAIQRAKRGNAEDIGLWVLRPETSPIPQRLLSRAAGEFAIAPESATLANPQADGIAILSLTPNVKP